MQSLRLLVSALLAHSVLAQSQTSEYLEPICTGSESYVIASFADLHEQGDFLDCIFAHGKAPARVPLGPYFGEVLTVLSSPPITTAVEALWRGKFAYTSRCTSNANDSFNVGFNLINGRFQIPALIFIGANYMTPAPGESEDGQPSLLIDYTQDFTTVCNVQSADPSVSQPLLSDPLLTLGALDNVYPFNSLLDVVRVVGRQRDGAIILLGKTFMRYPRDGDAINIAFWAFATYDTEGMTDINYGDPLPSFDSAKAFTPRKPELRRALAHLLTPTSLRGGSGVDTNALSDLVGAVRSVTGINVRPTRYRSSIPGVGPALDGLVSGISSAIASSQESAALGERMLSQSAYGNNVVKALKRSAVTPSL